MSVRHLVVTIASTAFIGCASATSTTGTPRDVTVPSFPTSQAPTQPAPPPPAAPDTPRTPDPIRSIPRNAHPGFDTRRYPGDAALRVWALNSPYEWVAYYLVAPCQTGPSWVGKRNVIREAGFSTAVVFIGEQDWSGPPSDSGAAAQSGGKQCTVANLTTAKGAIDAARADSTAAAEGFPNGTVVYLDVERVETLSPRFTSYIRSWVHEMLASGRYVPGIYVHERNAASVRSIITAEYSVAGRRSAPPFWVAARPAGAGTPASTFDLATARPATSGFAIATIWQGLFNVSETWGGVTLVIDVNVATSADPSGPR